MLTKKFIEFYITNVCNYNCDNCNRLNNYKFSGHENWKEHEKDYVEWSKKVKFEVITILGGEPLLHPGLIDWIKGIRECWPESDLTIVSNGSRLPYWHQHNLFSLLNATQCKLNISLHNRSKRTQMLEEICRILPKPKMAPIASVGVNWKDAYDQVKDPSWPECTSYDDFINLPDWIKTECIDLHKIDLDTWIQSTGKVKITDITLPNLEITVSYAENFVTAPLKYSGNNRFTVYDSDPVAAHDVCISKSCTHMMRGKMYKCHHVALLPLFSQQYQVDISEQDKKLLDSYDPLDSTADLGQMHQFFQKLFEPMPQCKLCPSTLKPIFLESTTLKPKVRKIVPIVEKHLNMSGIVPNS